MSRKQLNGKLNLDSEDEEVRHYLNVPYCYKDDAKRLGVRFDGNKKQWYVVDSNKHKIELLKLFNSDNLIVTIFGPVMKTSIKELITSFESDSSDEESSKRKFVKHHYLLVPFAYKDDAKRLGARFDIVRKEWYVEDSNENKQKLIDLYHTSNFTHTSNGPILKSKTMTLEEVSKQENERHQKHKQEKKKWIEKYGSEDGFNEWYSEHFNH
jgi:hypothetical protein